jgi:hypothetical protein
MAQIEIGPLSDRLADDEIADLTRAIEKLGARMPSTDENAAVTIADNLDDDVLAEFFDRLEAENIACEIYLPVEFDDRVDVGEIRVGSAAQLLEVLDEMRDDLDIEEDEDEADEDEDEEEEDDDYEDNMELMNQQLRLLWKAFWTGAEAALEKKVPLYVKGA